MNFNCLTAISLLVVHFSQLAPIHTDDQSGWMQYRGPEGAGRCESNEPLPAKLDLGSNLKWKTRIALGHFSPLVVKDTIILTGFEPGNLSTICFELSTGKLRWRCDVEFEKFERAHPAHGPATPTPVNDGDRILVAFRSCGLIVYDLEHAENWRDERSQHRNRFDSASSPFTVDGKLIVFHGNQDESLTQALNLQTDAVIWERRMPGLASNWSTPVVWKTKTERTLLVYEPFNLRCISLATGSDIWSIPGLADEATKRSSVST